MSGSVGTAVLTGGIGQAAGSLVVPTIDAGKGVYSYLKHKYDYIKNLDKNFEYLIKEANYLTSREQDICHKVARNQIIMEKTHECSTWLEDVGKMKRILADLKTTYQKSSSGSCGLCQWCRRLKLSRKIVKTIQSIVELRDRMNPEHIVLRERQPDRVEKKFPKNLNEVPSLQEHVKRLLEYLEDDSIKKIGIWGMSGVGKTMILENLNDEVEKLKNFEIVLWVTVSKEDSICQIKQDIMKRLRLRVEEIGNENEATLISKSLKNKKYLLIMDEVFFDIKLHQIGIHDDHMHGKVVLATRERVICNWMKMDEEIKVERLSRDDARKLFRDAAGEVVDHPRIKPIAERVLRQCGELPEIIRAVGSHLKGKLNEDLWQSTLSKFRSPNMFPLKHMEDVFNVFKVIYEELHDNIKNCLLYGASFPEDHEIHRDYLIECWKAQELIGIGETFRKARVEGHDSLDDLIKKCLFDGCKGKKYVKMPIIFRNTAIRISNQHKVELLVRDKEELESYPAVEKWVNAKVVSFVDSNIKVLPTRPECPIIRSLFLQKNENLCVTPATFFDYMSSLRVLDVCGTGIDDLPPSISNLTNLRGLYLNDCHNLVNLPNEIGQLQKLEILDICRSGIYGLPLVIGEFTRLQCLRLSFTSVKGIQNYVKVNGIYLIWPKVIERLQQLEELTIDLDPKEFGWNKIAPTIAAELAKLETLTSLSFYFPSMEALEAFTRSSVSWRNDNSHPGKNFRSFDIYVGSSRRSKPQLDISKCSNRRYLQYSGGKDTPIDIGEVLNNACAFELIDHQNITMLSNFGINRMECLEICLVEGCSKMTNIVHSNSSNIVAFPWLRELHLNRLHQLNDICQGSICRGSFSRLTTLTLCDCPNVTKVVSLDMAKQLHDLQHLRVERCSQVIEIIGADIHSSGGGAFPKLKMLELVTLQALVSIHPNDLFEWCDLHTIEINECDNLVNLCLNTMNAMKLRHIRCNEDWWVALMLNEEVKAYLQGKCCFH